LILVFALSAHAQDVRGRLQGVVTDQSQAVIAGAKVTILNAGTGYTANTTTGSAGEYLFNFVPPGTYQVTVEATGFERWLQGGVIVQTLGDITVNAALTLGAVTQTINVTATALAMEYNTTTMSQTVDGTMLKELPVIGRNPFTLALLDPAVVNYYGTMDERNPFFSMVANGVDVGNTLGRNDIQLDGMTIVVGSRSGWTPPMDVVQEMVVQQNSVDASFGQSAGGILSVQTKAGTNDLHGMAYYYNRNPDLNAVTNNFTRTASTSRYNIGGVNAGGPIKKNKLFFFGSYEKWHSEFPFGTVAMTLPTTLERTGDFSQSLNQYGTLRTIYNPWSTTIDPTTGAVSRTAFTGNKIPSNMVDASGAVFMSDVWQPNRTGDNQFTHVNNWEATFPWWSHYDNWSGRADYTPTEKWHIFYRYSQFREWESNNNYSGDNSPAFTDDDGGLTATINTVGDALYTINPSTILDIRFGLTTHGILYGSPWAGLKGGDAGYARFWPNNNWFQPYEGELEGIGAFYPRLYVGSYYSGITGFWLGKPRKESNQVTLVKHHGIHDLKFGGSLWHQWEIANLPNPFSFSFTAADTANTFQSPDTTYSGDAFAALLLGTVQGSSSYTPIMRTKDDEWAFFVQDDIKLNRRVTLNIGLRDEYETGISEGQNKLGQTMLLNAPISYMQAAPPIMPTSVTQYGVNPSYTGLWQFATPSHDKVFGTPLLSLQPRLGVAIRITDKSAVRIGYARYGSTLLAVIGPNWDLPSYGFSANSNVLPFLAGVPQATLSDPFPASNPLVLPIGNALGGYSLLGNSASWFNQSVKTPINDRFDFNYQFMLPGSFRMDATYFLNFGHNVQPPSNGGGGFQSFNYNMMNPALYYKYGTALDEQVANPFYGYGTPTTFPGPLRSNPQVSIASLLVPYPQYGSLVQKFNPGFSERYQALQLKAERAFSRGFTLMLAYNYNHESSDIFFNNEDTYVQKMTMYPVSSPRNRLNASFAYNLPVGRGQKYLPSIPKSLDAVIGGWRTSHNLMWHSGDFLRFGQMNACSSPRLPQPTYSEWFDTSCFQASTQVEPYAPRLNPLQYPGVNGPRWWELDSSLSKQFNLTERFKLELRFEAYNLTNSFMPSDPDTNVYSSTFGRVVGQANIGRECQANLRLQF
jgi:hypothetical protein